MTPDLKRLCDAVWLAETSKYFREVTGEQSSEDASPHDRARYEAIVRAVLIALREPSEEVIASGGCALDLCERPTNDDEGALRAFTAMINQILIR